MPRPILESLSVGSDTEENAQSDDVFAQELQEVMARLSAREQRVLRFRYFNDGRKTTSYRSIGREEGVSGERIRQVEQRAKQRLRALLKRD